MSFQIEDYIYNVKRLVDEELRELLPEVHGARTKLSEAMRYSVEAGGKRLRPVLAVAACEAVGGEAAKVMPVACAIEMIHTYSLIHDDLPAMDDDTLRRGVPSNHSVYGDAVAILAGDALLTDAFKVIATRGVEKGLTPEVACAIIADVALAAGSAGMVGGQAFDLALEGREVSLDEIESVHLLKTSALIEASVVAGGRAGGAGKSELTALKEYGRALGLAFQIIDDVLDIEGGAGLGKVRGSDERRDKATYPAVMGVEVSKDKARDLTAQAIDCLKAFGDNAIALTELARYLGDRKY